eukprot:TRINITY_DN663_c0_g2_i1.p1 TRINITY_DN663_c0_g2~~TRINITY_DN663_c0_g2_i1.p1  ORF type:complete len:258 (-),score=70.69 TRINITY_DN663_c0_g2_i1:21-794(-)
MNRKVISLLLFIGLALAGKDNSEPDLVQTVSESTAVGVASATAAAVVSKVAVGVLGFAANGVAAGSVAAGWMGPLTASGSIFATLQTAGTMGIVGAAAGPLLPVVAGTGTAAAVGTLLYRFLSDGRYTEMKDYLLEQYDSKTFDGIVKEAVHLAAELERTIKDTELGNQFFKTLTEFSSLCPKNQLALAEAMPINQTLMRLPNCDDSKLLELKNGMLELMLGLVNGKFPQKEAPNSWIPDISMSDFTLVKKLQDQFL